MKLLLDTHCWLWLREDPSKLPSPLRRRLVKDPSALVLSSVSVQEIVIKHATGKLRLALSPHHLVTALLEDGVTSLNSTIEHVLRLATLPHHHRDPFDRLLVAQAQVEDFTLVTADPRVLAYDVKKIDARK